MIEPTPLSERLLDHARRGGPIKAAFARHIEHLQRHAQPPTDPALVRAIADMDAWSEEGERLQAEVEHLVQGRRGFRQQAEGPPDVTVPLDGAARAGCRRRTRR